MPSILNSDDGVVSGTSGLKTTGGNDGITAFQQNGTERMRIDSSGNVGIGTNSPSYKLHVSGAGNQTAAVASSSSNAVLRLTSSNGFDQIIEYTTVSTAGLAIKDATAGLNRAYIDNNGNITFRNNISVGNATPTTSGAGITFPATQSASTNANTLDDYEEGTWTPSIGGNATYTAQQGTYVKIGRLVYINAYFVVNTKGTGSASTLSGLPFTRGDGNSGGSGLTVTYWSSSAVNLLYIAGNVNGNATTMTFNGTTSSATTANTVDAALFGDGTRIDFAGTYYASA